MNYRKVEKNQVEGYHNIEELVRIFGLKDERQIIVAFGKNLVILEDTLILESKYLVDRLGFDPTEPFMTRREVMDELGITFLQFSRLISKGLLPKFKMVQAKGSSILLLRRDVENLKKTIIKYGNPERLIDQSNKFRHVLELIFDYDLKYMKAISEKPRDLDILKMYFIDNRSREEIASQLKLNIETVRQSLMRGISRFDGFFKQMETHMTDVEKMQTEIGKLQIENSELRTKNQYLSEFIKAKPLDETSLPILNSLSDEPISLLTLVESADVLEMDMSVRLKNVLKKAQGSLLKNYEFVGNRSVLKLKWILETPIDSFYKYQHFGNMCMLELKFMIEEMGFYPNEDSKRITLTPQNILSRVSDKTRAWDFYSANKSKPVKLGVAV